MTNSLHYDATIKIASTVGTNVRTLRTNKRALACGLILAVAVEDFKWRDAWDAVKKAAKFSTMEKDEQNGFNVMGTACRTVIDHYDTLDKDQKEAISNLTATTSTMAKAIKDAIKAKEQAEAEEAKKAADAEAASKMADADIDGDKPAPSADVAPTAIQSASAVLCEALSLPLDHKFEDVDAVAIRAMLEAVDAFRARVVELSQAA